MLGWLKRRFAAPETRSAGNGYTAQLINARAAWITGPGGAAELTATVQACVSLWESGLSAADVTGTTLLDRHTLALIGRAVALRGEAVLLIDGDRLVPAVDWELTTRNSRPRAYRLTLPETGGGRGVTVLPGEVLHIRHGAEVSAPWHGTAPLRRAGLTAALLEVLESALRDAYGNMPLGSQVLPLPETLLEDADAMRASFQSKRGATLIVEGVAQATAAGLNPQLGQRREDLTPDLQRSMARETLEQARNGIAMAFGVLPGMLNPAVTGPLVREGQRHLATWALQPLAGLIAEEATAKLAAPVALDVMRPLQAFDAGGRARAMGAVIKALAEAKEAGIDAGPALRLVDWGE